MRMVRVAADSDSKTLEACGGGRGDPGADRLGSRNGLRGGMSGGRSYATLRVEHPRLWWPNGHGEPYLYLYGVSL